MNYFDPLHFGQDYMILPSEGSQQTARSSNNTCEFKKAFGVVLRATLTPVAQLWDRQALMNLNCSEKDSDPTSMTLQTVSRLSLASLLMSY